MLACCVAVSGAQAQTTSIINQDVTGFNLPGVQLPQGHDEVRAADGTTCRSAVSGAGAYLDTGVIGNPNPSNGNGVSAYGRIVIPLGRKPARLDCGRLYDLEVQRLQMELRLMQMGLGRQGRISSERTASIGDGDQGGAEAAQPVAARSQKQAGSGDWADEGWSTEGKD
ncbi:MAG: hypothetical protein R3D45_16660 [Rhizobiaceae bacterium]